MKFLSKDPNSQILKKNIVYKRNNSKNNSYLTELLLKEQKNFCAYTERYFKKTDKAEVEHFNPDKKYNDDYINYYAVCRWANLQKLKKWTKNSKFFDTLFFQKPDEFQSRIQYMKGDGVYEEIDENDTEAADLIEYLGFNHNYLRQQRDRHVKRLKEVFKIAGYDKTDQQLNYFKKYKEELDFITAIEVEFGLDLTSVI